MDRYPYATPPRWWSPRPNRLWLRLWKPIRRLQQRYGHGVRQVDVVGLEHVQRAMQSEHGVLITPNHASHADCYLLLDALTRLPGPSYVMTAWQVFHMMRRWQQLAYRHHGCFSVNREGRDYRAFRTAVEILADTSHPLVVFPEGEVYHLNDQVTAFRDGTTIIASAAIRRGGRPVACVPCALKLFYISDPTKSLTRVADSLEQKLQIESGSHLPLARRVERLQIETLQWRERQYLDEVGDGPLDQRRDELIESILQAREVRWDINRKSEDVPTRVNQLRQRLIVEIESSSPDATSRCEAVTALEDVFVAVQLYSYRFDYVSDCPTIERIAETIDKLEEDVLGAPTARVRGRRRGVIAFGAPILISAPSDRAASRDVAGQLRQRVQALVNQIASGETCDEPPEPRGRASRKASQDVRPRVDARL